MPRYIDADALCEHLQKKLKTDYEMGLYNHYDLTESFIRFVERQPTADVAEVRHAHWITQEEAEVLDRPDLAYSCSACQQCNWDCTESEDFNYCPNCGAKMERSEQ